GEVSHSVFFRKPILFDYKRDSLKRKTPWNSVFLCDKQLITYNMRTFILSLFALRLWYTIHRDTLHHRRRKEAENDRKPIVEEKKQVSHNL
ncbi:hypothetical protein, partial [Bacteroides rodentium]